jgi:hypothetical protein
MASHRSDPGVLGFASLCPGTPSRVSQSSDPRISRYFPMASHRSDPVRPLPAYPRFPVTYRWRASIRPGTSRFMSTQGFPVTYRWQATDPTRYVPFHAYPRILRFFPMASHRSDPGVLGFASLCPGTPSRVSQSSDPLFSRYFTMASHRSDPGVLDLVQNRDSTHRNTHYGIIPLLAVKVSFWVPRRPGC